MFALIKTRYYSIGFKMRMCLLLSFLSIVLFVVASEYFKVDFKSIHSFHKEFSGKSRQSDFDWDGWVKKNNFLSIGDVYDNCDPTDEDRVKIGKAILSYNKKNRKIMATVVTNITLVDDMISAKANIYVKYRGRTFFNETYDVCSDLAEDVEELKCPKKKGQIISIHQSKTFPSRMPKGYFVVVGWAVNQNNKCLALIEAEFEI